jgi:hypothetical protein
MLLLEVVVERKKLGSARDRVGARGHCQRPVLAP